MTAATASTIRSRRYQTHLITGGLLGGLRPHSGTLAEVTLILIYPHLLHATVLLLRSVA